MPKENCKYWDKCYQKNEYHIQKYNHPEKNQNDGNSSTTNSNQSDLIKDETKSPKRNMPSDEKVRKDITNSVSNAVYETEDLRQEALSNIAGKNYMEILHKRIKFSEKAEYDNLLASNEFIRHKFLVEMPQEFYDFWTFISELKADLEGEKVLEHVKEKFQLQLVGPFEFLAGCFNKATIREPGDYLRHWRFFYDPPEFQTVFVRPGTSVHYGYWRDTPQDKEGLLVARNDVSKGCEFEFVAGNMFDAFLYYLDNDFVGTPFTAAAVANVKNVCKKFIEEKKLELKKLEPLKKDRGMHVVAKTFHRAGIVVPYDAKTEIGYRPMTVSDAELKKIIKLFETAGSDDDKDDTVKTAVMVKLQPVATAANIASDESDFGTSLELGLDLFCSGRVELHMLVQSLLVPAYSLLNRPQFIAISKAHLEKRRRDLNLSIFELDKK